jgi:hypothetical protein
MIRGRFPRRFLAILTLAGWVGFAGGGEAAELLAQALGFHGDCRMPCCREQANASCPRMRGDQTESSEAAHAHHAVQADSTEDASAPRSPLSLSARSTCEERCVLLAGLHRPGLTVEGAGSATPPANETAPPSVTTERPSVRFLRDVPSRAPPA